MGMRFAVKLLTASLMLVAIAGAAVAGPFEDGDAAYRRGDYATAYRLLRPLANRGWAWAQLYIGYMYEHGQGVAEDMGEALNWYGKATDQGITPEMMASTPLRPSRAAVSDLASYGTLVTPPNQNPSFRAKVPLKKDGGIFVVPVEMNGAITLEFGLDSGAADVTVPADVFSTLQRTGTITKSDIRGEQTYVLADGSKSQSVTFTIRSLKVGDKVVENVRGSVASSRGTPLLGQSFLERFKSWSVDNTKHELLLEPQ
jgi:clan AA aspartic protease (TIGR02281 family)